MDTTIRTRRQALALQSVGILPDKCILLEDEDPNSKERMLLLPDGNNGIDRYL